MVLVYIISDNTSNTLTFNKSKFIAFLYKVSNIEDVNNILSDFKVLYKDASHICYAYIIDNYENSSIVSGLILDPLRIVKDSKIL